MHNMSGYITAFRYAASCIVGITDDEILNRFVVGIKPKLMNRFCFHRQIPLKRSVLLLKEWVLYV